MTPEGREKYNEYMRNYYSRNRELLKAERLRWC
jgi:hypothetical protein